MQEHPSHYKNSKNTANAKPSDIIYDDQVRLSYRVNKQVQYYE